LRTDVYLDTATMATRWSDVAPVPRATGANAAASRVLAPKSARCVLGWIGPAERPCAADTELTQH